MGLAIITKGREAPFVLLLHLQCDMPRCRQEAKFVAEPCEQRGFIELHTEAIGAGWLERFSTRPPEQRLFLCPSCSGKEPTNGHGQESLSL